MPSSSEAIRESIKEPGTQVYVMVSGEKYLNSLSDLLVSLIRAEGRKGLLLSTIWSANAISRRFSLSKLPKGSLKVIDTYSMNLGSAEKQKDDFIFLPTPVSLEMILIEIERILVNQKGEYSFLIVDSMTSMKRFFTSSQISEFFRYLLSRMLEEEMKVIVFDQDSQKDDESVRKVSSVMDGLVDLSEEVD